MGFLILTIKFIQKEKFGKLVKTEIITQAGGSVFLNPKKKKRNFFFFFFK